MCSFLDCCDEFLFRLNFIWPNEFWCIFSFSFSRLATVRHFALFARSTFISVLLLPVSTDILCYFMLCFVLFFASRLSFITVSIWKAPAHIHNVATLQQENIIVVAHSNDERKLPTQRFVGSAIRLSMVMLLKTQPNDAKIFCQTMNDFWSSIINYTTDMLNRTIYSQQSVLDFLHTNCGFWKSIEWCTDWLADWMKGSLCS